MRTFLSLVVALVLPPSTARAQAVQGTAADEAAIRQIGTQIPTAWNKGDAKALADLWLVDGDYVSSTGRVARGRAEVRRAFTEQWAGVYKGTKLATTTTSIRFVKADVAVVDGTFEITGMKGQDGKALPVRSGLTTIVAVKKGDLWYIAALRGMVPSTPPGSTSK